MMDGVEGGEGWGSGRGGRRGWGMGVGEGRGEGGDGKNGKGTGGGRAAKSRIQKLIQKKDPKNNPRIRRADASFLMLCFFHF